MKHCLDIVYSRRVQFCEQIVPFNSLCGYFKPVELKYSVLVTMAVCDKESQKITILRLSCMRKVSLLFTLRTEETMCIHSGDAIVWLSHFVSPEKDNGINQNNQKYNRNAGIIGETTRANPGHLLHLNVLLVLT